MTPLRQAVGTIKPSLESLYEDLDTYIKELDNTESLVCVFLVSLEKKDAKIKVYFPLLNRLSTLQTL